MALLPFVGLLLLTQSKVSDTTFRVQMGAWGPRAEVRYARPTLRWEIWPVDPKRSVVTVRLAIDGRAVEATYDTAGRAVSYIPAKPFAPGTYKVECRVTFDNGGSVDRNWETRIAKDPVMELPSPEPNQREALAAANRLRLRTGLPDMTGDDRLSFAALLHSQYLSQNKAFGHTQDPSAPGYFGASGALRLEAYGYVGGSWEGVDFGSHTSTEAIRNLFDAPYHRLPFLQPGRVPFGSGFVDQRTTIEFGRGDEEGTVLSPSDGEIGVPPKWLNFETPNPLRNYPNAAKTVGYPIVLVRHGRRPEFGAVAAKLIGPGKELVPCYVVPHREQAAVILIPQEPLQSRTWYEAEFDESNLKVYRSRFQTAG